MDKEPTLDTQIINVNYKDRKFSSVEINACKRRRESQEISDLLRTKTPDINRAKDKSESYMVC